MERLEPYMRDNPKGSWEDWVFNHFVYKYVSYLYIDKTPNMNLYVNINPVHILSSKVYTPLYTIIFYLNINFQVIIEK